MVNTNYTNEGNKSYEFSRMRYLNVHVRSKCFTPLSAKFGPHNVNDVPITSNQENFIINHHLTN